MRKEHVLRDGQLVRLLLVLVQHLAQPTVGGSDVGLIALETEVVLHLTRQNPVLTIFLIATEVFHTLVIDSHQLIDERSLLRRVFLLRNLPIHDADTIEIDVLRSSWAFVVGDLPIRIGVLEVVHLGIRDKQTDIRQTPNAVFSGTKLCPVVHSFLCICTHYRRQEQGDTQESFDVHILIVFLYSLIRNKSLSVFSFNLSCV